MNNNRIPDRFMQLSFQTEPNNKKKLGRVNRKYGPQNREEICLSNTEDDNRPHKG